MLYESIYMTFLKRKTTEIETNHLLGLGEGLSKNHGEFFGMRELSQLLW